MHKKSHREGGFFNTRDKTNYPFLQQFAAFGGSDA